MLERSLFPFPSALQRSPGPPPPIRSLKEVSQVGLLYIVYLHVIYRKTRPKFMVYSLAAYSRSSTVGEAHAMMPLSLKQI